MINYSQSNKTIALEVGSRLKSLRLKENLTQKAVAKNTGLSLKAIQSAEKGESKLITYIKILRELNKLETIENFIPKVSTVSPLQMAKLEGKIRQRASGERLKFSVQS